MKKSMVSIFSLSWVIILSTIYLAPEFVIALGENARIKNVFSNELKYNLGETVHFKIQIHNTGSIYLNELSLNLDISGPNNRNIRQGQIISGIDLNISKGKLLNWSWEIQRNAMPGVYYVTVGLWNKEQTKCYDIKYGVVTFKVASEFILLYSFINSFSPIAWLVLLSSSFSGAALAYQVKKRKKTRAFNLFIYAAFSWIATAVLQQIYWILASISLALALLFTTYATILLRFEVSYSDIKLLVKKIKKNLRL